MLQIRNVGEKNGYVLQLEIVGGGYAFDPTFFDGQGGVPEIVGFSSGTRRIGRRTFFQTCSCDCQFG